MTHPRKPWLRAFVVIAALAVIVALHIFGDIASIGSTRSNRAEPVAASSAWLSMAKSPPADHSATGDPTNLPGDSELSTAGNRSIRTTTNAAPVAYMGLTSSRSDSEAPVDQSVVPVRCWGLRGSAPEDFVVGIDEKVRTSGRSSATIAALRDSSGYGSLFQFAAAEGLRGKRVEFSVDLRTVGVKGSANMYFRAEDATGKPVAFDNMWMNYDEDRSKELILNRGVSGDTAWSTQHVVLDIPKEAVAVTYGVFLVGSGKVWIDNARIEVASDEMPTTAPAPLPEHLAYLPPLVVDLATLPATPKNLGFERGDSEGCR